MISEFTLILVVKLCKNDVVTYDLPQKVVNIFKKVVSFIIGLNLFLVIG